MEWKTVLWKWSSLQGLVKQEMLFGTKACTKILLKPNKIKRQKKILPCWVAVCTVCAGGFLHYYDIFSLCLY